MKKKDFLSRSLLFGALSLALAACGNEEMLDGPGGNPGGEHSRITIAVSTPASEGVVVRGMQTRATVADETDESTVNSLNVFLFKKDGGDTDANYKYYNTYSFEAAGLADGGNGSKTCAIDIDKELMGATVKIALSANDKSAMALEKGTTTLDAFKTALATAVANNDDKADVLVGGEANKSFPMSCIVSEAQELTSLGVDVKATLVRNVARLDIFNHTPNLKITAVKMSNVNNKSCLFGAENALNVPTTDLNKIGLSPLKEFADKLDAGLIYQTPDQETEESARKSNTHRVSYLYEQAVTDDASSPVVTIEYTLDVAGHEQAGSVEVKFQKSTDQSFVNVERNTLYRIKLGDGSNVGTGSVKAKFEVADWNLNEDINTDLDPGKDGNQAPDYTGAALGDIMLADGTLVKADAITEEQKAKAVGIVAFLYNADRQPKDGVKNALAAKGQNNPTGLVLALKNADAGAKVTWADTNANVGYISNTLSAAYADGKDGYTITSDLSLKTGYPAFVEVAKYETSVPTSGITCTGWYIPSIGEWIDIMSSAGIGNISEVDDVKTLDSETASLSDKGNVAASNLNTHLDKVGSSNVDNFFTDEKTTERYWSSSEYNETLVYRMYSSFDDKLHFNSANKISSNSCLVRCVLAF